MKCPQIIISRGFIENLPIIASNVEVGKLHVSFGLDDSQKYLFSEFNLGEATGYIIIISALTTEGLQKLLPSENV